MKIRDLRPRRNLIGKKSMPRLRQKTHPMVIGANEAVDFEEEAAKYKQDIQEDIEKYTRIYCAKIDRRSVGPSEA